MKITPEQFLQSLKDGKKESDLNKKESDYICPNELKKINLKKIWAFYRIG